MQLESFELQQAYGKVSESLVKPKRPKIRKTEKGNNNRVARSWCSSWIDGRLLQMNNTSEKLDIPWNPMIVLDDVGGGVNVKHAPGPRLGLVASNSDEEKEIDEIETS